MGKNRSWEKLLREYKESPEILAEAVRDLSDAELDQTPDDENWSIREIVHHIIDGDSLWTAFIKQALGGQDRPFELFWYWDLTQDEWAEKWSYGTRPIEPGLALLQANRDYLVSLLSSNSEAGSHSLEIPSPDGDSDTWSVRRAMLWNLKHTQVHLEEIKNIQQTIHR
jgi:hypothetical protein